MLALAGCQESGFDESRETQRPLKVQHAMDMLAGTRVPGQAERPMTLTVATLGDTLALDLQPVRAALPGARVPGYMRAAAEGVEVVAPLTELDIAATGAAEPDVILGSADEQGELYEELKRIAPTIMDGGRAGDWKLDLRLHGEALGRTNDAERLLIDWDRRLAEVRDRIGERDLSVVLEGMGPIGPSSFARRILDDLGVGVGTGGGEVVRVKAGPQWTGGGILAARAALADIAAAL